MTFDFFGSRPGCDGCDGHTQNFRGRHNAYQKYQQFDVIEFDGSSFVALHDDPGVPGDNGWQLLCHRGNRGVAGDVGPRGRKGERGARGEDAPTIVSWTLDRKNYRAVPAMSNGMQGAVLELRGLFEQFVIETSYAVEAPPDSQVLYITITVASGTAIGKTVDAKIGVTPGRVTLLSEETLRIEPDDVCRIITAATEDGRMTICAIGRRSRA